MQFKKIFLGGVCAVSLMLCMPQQVLANEVNSTIKKVDGTYYYYENGEVNTQKCGVVDFNGSKFFIANGRVETEISGLANDLEHKSDWYYLANGQVQTQHTGLVEYDGAWFYVDNGKLDTEISDFVEYDGGLFFVGAGRIMKEVNGLAQDPNGTEWYYLAGGQAQTQYTGLVLYDNEWFYVIEGKLAGDYTGIVSYDGSEFYVVNGMVQNNTGDITDTEQDTDNKQDVETEQGTENPYPLYQVIDEGGNNVYFYWLWDGESTMKDENYWDCYEDCRAILKERNPGKNGGGANGEETGYYVDGMKVVKATPIIF